MNNKRFKDISSKQRKASAANILLDAEQNNEDVHKKEIIRKTTSLTLDVELMADIKLYAMQNKKKMYEIIESALSQYLQEH